MTYTPSSVFQPYTVLKILITAEFLPKPLSWEEKMQLVCVLSFYS